jgi:hypothetical protein
MRRSIYIVGCALAYWIAGTWELARALEPPIVLDPSRPARSWIAGGTTQLAPPIITNGLVNIPPYQIGWFDFDFSTSRKGWYRVVTNMNPSRVQFVFDPSSAAKNILLLDLAPVGTGEVSTGWVLLPGGAHVLRIQNYFWTGFPEVSKLRLEVLPEGHGGGFQLLPPATTVFRKGACSPIIIDAGGGTSPYEIEAVFVGEGRLPSVAKVRIPPSKEPKRFAIDVPCLEPGDITVDLFSLGPPHSRSRVHSQFTVFETAPVCPRSTKDLW